MRRNSPTDLAASVRQRLLNIARAQGEELQLVLTRYGVERLLYRLGRTSAGERFVLKGAVLFYLWDAAPHRPTRDVDFLAYGDVSHDAIMAAFHAVCSAEVEPDGLTFHADSIRVDPIRDRQEYGGIRVTLLAMLGTARIPLQVDIGIGDAVTPDARMATFPTLLDFPAPRVRAYPAETVVAEKFHAIVELGIANTRMKDFFDVWLLSATHRFDGATLAAAIAATFVRRGTPLPEHAPLALTDQFAQDPAKQAQWRAFVERGRLRDAPTDLGTVVKRIATFVLAATRAANATEHFSASWIPAGEWTQGYAEARNDG